MSSPEGDGERGFLQLSKITKVASPESGGYPRDSKVKRNGCVMPQGEAGPGVPGSPTSQGTHQPESIKMMMLQT